MITNFLIETIREVRDPIAEKQKKVEKATSYLTKYVEDKTITPLDLSYLMNFLKGEGSIANIKWLAEILNKIKNDKCFLACQKIYDILKQDEAGLVYVDSEQIMNSLVESKKEVIEFNEDQKTGINKVIDFLVDKDQPCYCYCGYAGVGKTLTIVELVSFLIKNKYIRSICFATPTNKSIGTVKIKFVKYLKEIMESLLIKKNEEKIEDLLDELHEHGVRIDFVTIHRLLCYKNEFTNDGDRIFIRGGKNSIHMYDLIVIDECSMIPKEMIENIFGDIRNSAKTNIFKKKPKLIFVGDPCQISPVNQDICIVFGNNIANNNSIDKELKADILKMEMYTLKTIMRNQMKNVNDLAYNIRQWINNEIKFPKIKKYAGNGVYIYKNLKNVKKTDSEWFQKAVDSFKESNEKTNTSTIILAWTNKQCDEYNNRMRNVLFGKDGQQLDAFVIGDILVLNDFYCFEDNNTKTDKTNTESKNVFYTSEQLKVTCIDQVIRRQNSFSDNIFNKSAQRIKNFTKILEKYRNTTRNINKSTSREYHVWKLSVQKLNEVLVDTIPDVFQIHVIHEISKDKLIQEKEYASEMIKKLRKTLAAEFKDQIKQIDKCIINSLWKEWSKIFVEPFANVNSSMAMTINKSQSSGFYTVYIDIDDILNCKSNDAKRYIYTAITRSCNNVLLLV